MDSNKAQQYLSQGKALLGNLSKSQKRSLVASGFLVTAVLASVIFYSSRMSYELLYSGIDNKEGGQIITKLKEWQVPYNLSEDGRTIWVEKGKAGEVRLNLASEGLPQGSGVGFEIFDNKG